MTLEERFSKIEKSIKELQQNHYDTEKLKQDLIYAKEFFILAIKCIDDEIKELRHEKN